MIHALIEEPNRPVTHHKVSTSRVCTGSRTAVMRRLIYSISRILTRNIPSPVDVVANIINVVWIVIWMYVDKSSDMAIEVLTISRTVQLLKLDRPERDVG